MEGGGTDVDDVVEFCVQRQNILGLYREYLGNRLSLNPNLLRIAPRRG